MGTVNGTNATMTNSTTTATTVGANIPVIVLATAIPGGVVLLAIIIFIIVFCSCKHCAACKDVSCKEYCKSCCKCCPCCKQVKEKPVDDLSKIAVVTETLVEAMVSPKPGIELTQVNNGA